MATTTAQTPSLDEIRDRAKKARDRVLLRAVRRHVRTPEREARPRGASGGPAERGSRLRRVRRRRDRPGTERPRHRGHPRPGHLHPAPVEPLRGPLCLRHPRRRRGVALRPPYDPAPAARGRRARRASSSRWGSSSSTSSSQPRDDGSIELADRMDTLEKPCYDLVGLTRQPRLPHHRLHVRQRARLGQLRERPRGRERPVRAELHLRQRAHEL